MYLSSSWLLRYFFKELNRKAEQIICPIPVQIPYAKEPCFICLMLLFTHCTTQRQHSGSTSGLKPDFKRKSNSPGLWPNSGHGAWDKSLDSSKLPVSPLGHEAGVVCKVFPILKLNDVCLFLERLSGSSWANGRTSALLQIWGDRKAFSKLQSPLWTCGIITTPVHMQKAWHTENLHSLPQKLKTGKERDLKMLTRGATKNTGDPV